MTGNKVMKLWTVLVTAFMAVLASFGFATTATATSVQEQAQTRNCVAAPAEEFPAPAPWTPSSDQPRPPTMRQRISAEAHGASPSCRPAAEQTTDEAPADSTADTATTTTAARTAPTTSDTATTETSTTTAADPRYAEADKRHDDGKDYSEKDHKKYGDEHGKKDHDKYGKKHDKGKDEHGKDDARSSHDESASGTSNSPARILPAPVTAEAAPAATPAAAPAAAPEAQNATAPMVEVRPATASRPRLVILAQGPHTALFQAALRTAAEAAAAAEPAATAQDAQSPVSEAPAATPAEAAQPAT